MDIKDKHQINRILMHWKLFIISLALLQSYVAAEDSVIELTDDTYEETIKNNPFVMVKFYAPWCQHCKEFAPEYEKAAKTAKEQNKPYILAKLDATVHEKAAAKEKLEGFPTVKLFINGSPIEYKGDREADAVLAYLDKKTGPPSTKLESKEDIIKVKDAEGLRCIFGTKNDDLMTIYSKTALSEDDFLFYHTTPELLAEVFPEAKENNIVLLKDFDEKIVIYNDDIEEDDIKELLGENTLPLVSDLDLRVIQYVFTPSGKNGVFLFRDPNASNAKELEGEFKKAATDKRSSSLVFTQVDLKSEWGQRIGEFFGIGDADLPIIEYLVVEEDAKRYRFEGEFKNDNIEKFIEDCKEGRVKRFLKSEPEPKENNGPVYKVVGSTFKRDVLDNDDDIILMFYAPWCGHCKKFEPIYADLAKTLSENKKLKFMNIDGTENDVEGHAIEGFPTIKFFPGKNKDSPITYSGERSEADVAKFIKEHASNPVDIPEFKSKGEEDIGKEDL